MGQGRGQILDEISSWPRFRQEQFLHGIVDDFGLLKRIVIFGRHRLDGEGRVRVTKSSGLGNQSIGGVGQLAETGLNLACKIIDSRVGVYSRKRLSILRPGTIIPRMRIVVALLPALCAGLATATPDFVVYSGVPCGIAASVTTALDSPQLNCFK